MNMDMLPVLSQMGILFLTAALGFVGAKTRVMDENSNQVLSKIVLNLTLPCTVLYSACSAERLLTNAQVCGLMLLSAASTVVLIVLSKLLMAFFRVPKEQRGVCEFLLLFSNVGFIGYPIMRMVFGPGAVFYAAIISMIYTLLSYSYGVILIRGRESGGGFTWRDLLSPMSVSSVVACGMYLLHLRPSDFVLDFLKFVDQATSPFSMIIIGCSLGFAQARQLRSGWRVYGVLAVRMIAVPMLCWYGLGLLVENDLVAGVFALMFALPSAASTTMFCARYGRDQTLASSAVLVSTLFSIVTLPLLCGLLFL